MKKSSYLFTAVLVATLLLSACGAKTNETSTTPALTTPAKTAEPVKQVQIKMASWSKPITEASNLLAADDKGWFKEKGIDFIFIPGAGGGDALKNILSGQADIAFTDPGSLLFALDKGEKLRVIYNIYPQNVFNVVSLKDKKIVKPADLKGKKIGVYSLASGTRHNLLVLLNQAGLTEKDVTIVETGVANFAPLIQGQVDVTAATDTGLLEAKLKGLADVNVIDVKDYLNIPSDLFVVTEDTYQKRKEDLKKFLQVYRQSSEWMIKNPDAAADVAVAKAIDGKDKNRNLEIIKLRNSSSIDLNTDKNGLGALDVNILQLGADTYKKLGLIENNLKMQDVVSTDLIPNK